ncbi:S9 family peptidase [candidate division KSB1 bacterium]|nr:MAG: S9 family peptidase [candidate division KSB1 bacterium]MBC6948321.1 S9 family peptidase [candidate division KSB1 bacterium]MCE7945075.1 S9 family peptidase [Chlorobi bacterium CHB1]MDL1875926.1 S9 family peptidase [Cytophagia bacterium CHB2]
MLGLHGGVSAVYSQETHPFTVHDLLAMDRISETQVSPDGKWAVFTLRKTDLEANRGRTDLWLVDVDGAGLRQLTSHPGSDYSPAWSRDGKSIWFLSTRSGSAQVWRIAIDGGEAEQKTNLPFDAGTFQLSPDNALLAVTMEVFPECESIDCTQKRDKEIASRKASGRIYDKLFIRHWDTWKDGKRSHLFVQPAAGGEAIDLMKGMDADCPSKPFGGSEEYTFTPDSKGLVFTARVAGREEAWSTNFDLYFVPVDGSAKPKNLTESNPAWDTAPVFSPDGKTLAYLAMKRPGYESDRFRIVLKSWSASTSSAGAERVLTEAWDRSPGGITWAKDNKTIYTIAGNLGQHSLFAIDAASGNVRTVVEKGSVRSVGLAGNRLLFGMDHHRSPVELYSVAPNGSDVRAVTRINAGTLAKVRMGESEQFTFKGWNDETVYAYVVKPADFDPSKKYPVAFLIHGGPQGSFGNDFHYRWNPQTYAGAGYAAVMVDFHGSTGYGQAFCDAIRGDWGGKPLEDLQKGLSAALAKYPWLDGERVAALGASYGGYMINWIAGNWSDRFKCLVNHDGNLDERLAYYDTEELWFPEWDHMGKPWENPENYEKHNPVNFVQNWKTPMLVVHGGRDFRVVETQGISTFTALQRRGIPSKFLYFPDENHWVLKPQNSILWHETVLGWLNQWTKPEGTN